MSATGLLRSPEVVDWICGDAFSIVPSAIGTSLEVGTSPYGAVRALKLSARLVGMLIESGPSNEWIRQAHGCVLSALTDIDENIWSTLTALCNAACGGTTNRAAIEYEQRNAGGAGVPQQQLSTTGALDAVLQLTHGAINKVRLLQPNQSCIIPGAIAVSDEQSIFIILVVHRPSGNSSTGNGYDVAVVNTSGFGSEYHCSRLHPDPMPGIVQKDGLLVIRNVPQEKLTHSSFWVMFYRLAHTPGPTNAHTLYAVLLPHLSCTPLYNNWHVDNTFAGIAPPPPPSSTTAPNNTAETGVSAAAGTGPTGTGTGVTLSEKWQGAAADFKAKAVAAAASAAATGTA
eukprot:Lankesteria_metandrocarpae@DN1319_c0_g1_i1.p1